MATAWTPQIATRGRRSPTQRRSRETVDAILIATERLIERDGIAGLNTRRIAEVAGVSVGSLYQYFANKEALIAAVLTRFVRRQFDAARRTLVAHAEAPTKDQFRALVEASIDTFLESPEIVRLLAEPPAGVPMDGVRALELEAVDLARTALEARADEAQVESPGYAAFNVTFSFIYLMRKIAVLRPEYLTEPRFRQELVRMFGGYLRPSPAHAIPH